MEKPYDSNSVMAFKNAFSSIPKMLESFGLLCIFPYLNLNKKMLDL